MTRILTTASLGALLVACNASTDSVDTATDAPTQVQGVAVCPDELVLGLQDYTAEDLPMTEDFTAWHVENAARDNVETTETGLQYKVIQAGVKNGLVPSPGEEVVVHYHGYFPNGEVFDSSYLRGSPMAHTSNGFIKGWNQSLDTMKVCEARTLYTPADLAYGNNGAGGRPAGTLIFNMQLIRVNRAAN